ncbi:MAG: hypothetical protein U9O24_08030, partial [Campylobacterota bacterium]|nr:hypothetical protein [Campylobacterota bacterium]
MYYITNHDKQIIAADSALINLLKVKNMSELYKEVLLENIQIVPSANKITIKIEKDEKVFDIKSHSLSSLLGNFTLIELIETIQTSEKENDNISKVLTHTEKENKAIENILSLKNKLAENRNKNISLEKDIEEKPEEKIENIAIETPKPMPIPLDDEILDDELF